MSNYHEYIIETEKINELNRGNVTSRLSPYAISDTNCSNCGADVSQLREEIVRCKDCKHFRFVDRSDIFHDERHNDSFCLRFVDGKRMEVEPDGFCAWGEPAPAGSGGNYCPNCGAKVVE